MRARSRSLRGPALAMASRSSAAPAAPAPRLGPARRPLELGGHILIMIGRGLGQVPGPPVGIVLRVGHRGQRRVQLLPLGQRCRAVGGRTGQRMAEPHPAVELDQSRVHRGPARLETEAQPLGRPPQQRPVAGRIGRRQLQQRRAGAGRASSWRAKLSSIRLVSGVTAGRPKPPASSARGQPARKFQQRQRIAAGLGHDQVADPRVQRPGQGRVKQRPGVVGPQALNHQHGLRGQFGPWIAGREHQRDRVGSQPARHETRSSSSSIGAHS